MNQHEEAVTGENAVSKFALSKSRTMTFDEILNDKVMWTSDVTGIPIGLLRTPHIWAQPIDMMVYLHFFTHSFGRNRRWCNMGILGLQKFCGGPGGLASKNTVRSSLERLTASHLIECIEPEAANQKTKKWLVRTPIEAELGCCKRETWISETDEENKPAPKPALNNPPNPQSNQNPSDNKSVAAADAPNPTAPIPAEAGSKSDPVNKQPGQNPTQTGSFSAPEGVNNRPGEGQNLTGTGSSVDPYKHLFIDPSQDPFINPSLKSPPLTEIFENYFSKIRAPKGEKKERDCLAQIQYRNPDVTTEEFLECYNLVSESKDSKGNPIAMKFLWMSNGFDTILPAAQKRILARNRRVEERQRDELKAQGEDRHAQQTTPEEVELAKDKMRKLFGPNLFRSMGPSQNQQPDQVRRAFLLNQTRQIQQIEKFGRL